MAKNMVDNSQDDKKSTKHAKYLSFLIKLISCNHMPFCINLENIFKISLPIVDNLPTVSTIIPLLGIIFQK